MIGFLSRLKADDEELANLRKVFMELDTSKDGFLSPEEIRAGMKQIKETFKLSLGKKNDYEPDWEQLVKCIDVNNDG